MGHFEEKPGVWVNSDYAPTAADYLAANPDVAKDAYFSARPLEHWERYGKHEGRSWGVAPQQESGGDDGGGESYSAPASLLPMPSTPAPEPINPPAPMNLPNLTLSDGASTVYQLNKLQSMDSLPMKQAEVNAFERGVASGAIHGSQQAGAAQRAVTDKLMPLAKTEADLVGNTEIANWSAEVKKEMQRYTSEYSGYLAKLGIQSSEKIAMVTANTSLSNSLLGSMTSLMNNPEIEFGDEVKNKLTSIFNNAMINNNTILDMGFSY